MKVGPVLADAEQSLKQAEIRTARLDALVLFEKAAGVKREWLLAHPERSVSKTTAAKLTRLIKQRARRVPLSQLTGRQEFWGLSFKVNEQVLIPRPESEKIVEYALSYKAKTARVLDVGTGCGCIAIAIAHERPNWQLSASEVSPQALKVASSNATAHRVKVELLRSNLLEKIKAKFDIITANLPYLKTKAPLTEEAKREPAVALFGGPDGLDLYRLFFAQLPAHIKASGLVIIESDPWQHPELIKIAGSSGLQLEAEDRFVMSFRA